jgi:hypothetical protein
MCGARSSKTTFGEFGHSGILLVQADIDADILEVLADKLGVKIPAYKIPPPLTEAID